MEQITPTIVRKTSPYLRRPKATVTRMMRDVTIALLPVTAFAIYSFGMAAVMIILLSILSMTATEYLYYQYQDFKNGEKFAFKNKSFSLYNFSAITSGLIYALTLPDSISPFVVIIGGVIGIFVAKLIFGGMGQNVFNPAAFARVFVMISYSATYQQHTLDIDGFAGVTALTDMANNAFSSSVLEHFSLVDLFTGIGIPGSIGEVSVIMILIGAIYLAWRTSFEVRIPIVYILTVFGLASAVAIYKDLGIWYPLYHVFSGGLLFGAVFMATDPITSPITKPGRIFFAFGLGFITFLIRLNGSLPEGVVFSILIMNMFVTSLDYYKWSTTRISKRGILIFAAVILVSIFTVLVGANHVG